MSGPVTRQGAVEGAARIRLFLTDVDGVLTDGGILFDAAGVETKRFHVRDGHGIKMLQRAGVAVGIITGRTSEVVGIRARELGIDIVRQGAKDKVAVWREILAAASFRGRPPTRGTTSWISRCFAPSGSRRRPPTRNRTFSTRCTLSRPGPAGTERCARSSSSSSVRAGRGMP
jgi:hypothetical protein